MFKLVANPRFSRTVEVNVPVDGGFEKHTFKATYQVIEDADGDGAHDLETTEGSTAFLRSALVSMDDLVGDDDKPLPYSDKLRDQLLKVPYIRIALARTYFQAVHKAALGN